MLQKINMHTFKEEIRLFRTGYYFSLWFDWNGAEFQRGGDYGYNEYESNYPQLSKYEY